MVLLVSSVRCPHQSANREFEARRIILPLVIAIRDKLFHGMRNSRVSQDMFGDSIDESVSEARFLVGERTGIAQAGQHQTVPNAA